jgi:hypothetical protein
MEHLLFQKRANLPIFAPIMNGLRMLERAGWADAETAILAVVDARRYGKLRVVHSMTSH